MEKTVIFIILIPISLNYSEVHAQIRDPQSPFYPNTPLELPEEQQEPILEIPSIQPNIIPSETIPRQVKIKSFEFIGNTVFTKEELETAVAQFINQEISFTQLLQIEAMITNLYMQSGYVNSGAVIEAGQIIEPDAAVIKIRIFEGAIEDIKILGTQRLNPSYIRNRVAFATEKPFNQKRLLEALQLLQLDPLIKNISAELSAGVRPNLSLLTLTIQEADSFDIIPFINNSGNPSIGSFNRGLGLEQGNLSGIGDKLFLIYTNSDGSNRIDVNYTLPLNPNNSTFTIAGGYSSNEVIERVFQELNLTGEYYYTEISWRQPILRNPAQELALGLTFSRQVSRNYLDGIGFPLSFGAEDDGNIKISSVSFFQDWLKRSASEVYGLRSQLTLGVNFFDATNNDNNIPDSNFLLWRTQAQYVRLVANDTLLVLRGDLQLSTEPLLSLNQISLGGLNSVRGYPQDYLLIDNGFFGSAELRLPIFKAEKIKGLLQIIPFIDYGIGWTNSSFPNPDPNNLLGIGIGLQWQMGDNLNARFDWGIPLTDVNVEEDTWNEQGLYFSVDYRF